MSHSIRLLFLILIACGGLTGVYYHQLTQNLNQQLDHEFATEKQRFESLWFDSNQNLEQLAATLPDIDNISSIVGQNNRTTLKQTLQKQFPALQNRWQLAHLQFYHRSGSPILSWPSTLQNPALNTAISQWVKEVSRTRQPYRTLDCSQQCLQLLIVPVNHNEQFVGIMLMTRTIEPLLTSFQQSSSKTIAVMTRQQMGYQLKLSHLDNRGDTDNVFLKSVLSQLKPVIGNYSHHFSANQNRYQLNQFTLDNLDPIYFFSIQEISLRKQQVILDTIVFGFIFLVTLTAFSAITIRIFRAKPSQQNINKDSDSLIVPSTISSNMQTQLKQLESHNKEIKTRLKKEKAALRRERDLVIKILDNVQAVVLTLEKDGTISSINLYGELLTGFHASELIGKNLIELYPDNIAFAEDDLKLLEKVAESKSEQIRQESRVKCRNGKELTILWLFSQLRGNQFSESPLLATGLDITENKMLEKNLSWLADHDTLTSLYNRRHFEEGLYEARDWIIRHQARGAILYIDLDHFKDLNDTLGHQSGDIILRKVASTLLDITTTIDASAHPLVARLAGDEFAIILRHFDKDGASILARKIIDQVFHIKHEQQDLCFQISCSIGVCEFPGVEDNHTELLANAVFAMNQAKVQGRNQYYLFKDADSNREKTNQSMIWREKIEHAIENERFILYYQPILDVQKRTISHYETLIRMLDENDEIVSPGSFINMAERLGLIREIDLYVLDSAIKKQAELLRQGIDIHLAINLSGMALDIPDLDKQIHNAVDKYGARAENLIFEITETAAVTDLIAAEKVISSIQLMGCRFALDDFGVGFSSFYYLRELPVEYVKIDGSFVKDLYNNADNQILVKALSEVAIGFNKLTIAEFVDSLETFNALAEAKVKYTQGYFIGKPSQQIPVDPPSFYQPNQSAWSPYN